MKTIVKSIKLLLWIAVISLLLTYIVSLNIELGFISFGGKLMSNSFLFAVFSGVFASSVVVLICELYKYFDTKKRIENLLYMQLAFLHGQLLMIRNSTGHVLQNPNEPLTHNLLQIPLANSSATLNNIKNVEYCSLKKKSKIEQVLNTFIHDGAIRLESFLIDCGLLDIAIREDKISYMLQGNHSPIITSTSEKSHEVLVILNRFVDGHINKVDSILIDIDSNCNGRYQWVERRNIISENIQYSKFGGVDEFIANNKL